jgi:DNA (cytosine-5)-methyltransferase 1
MDIQQDNGRGLRELALFAGAGGGILGGKLLGWRTVCAVEWDAYAASVLVARQNDGCLSPFPIWDDVQTFDGRPWRGRVDVISGGFPCQDISCAGKGAGITGERSSMWKHMARIIGEVRPKYAFVENSPMLVGRGLETVLADLAEMGYDAKWGIISASDAAAPHERERIWIVANDMRFRVSGYIESVDFSEARQRGKGCAEALLKSNPRLPGQSWPQPLLCGVDARLPFAVDRLKAVGNSQHPSVAALAWETLTNESSQNKL